jgi:hypothetical protein
MKKINIPKKELEKLTEEHKRIAQHFAFAWNPLGNPDIFQYIREKIFNFFLGRKHNLSEMEIEMIQDAISKTQGGQE